MKRKRRVALCLRSLSGGGAERVMVNLAKGFADRDLIVDMVLNVAKGPYLSDIPPNVRIVELGARRIVRVLPRLATYLRREQPVAVLSTLTGGNLTALLARAIARVPTRVVVREANMLSKSIENAKGSWYRRTKHALRLPIIRLVYPRADAIVALSRGVADDLVTYAGIPRHLVTTIHNPVDIAGIQSKAKEPVVHPWFQSSDIPVAIAVGRLVKQKDYPTLIRAFSEIRQTRPLRLAILGEGQEEASIKALIRDMGLHNDVIMLGWVSNPFAHVARSSVFVLSSAWEGLGTVIIEALAVGTPVVTTDCRSGPAEILEDGRYGRLVPVGAATSLARAIVDTLNGPIDEETLKSRASDFALGPRTEQFLDLLIGDYC